MFTLIFLFSLWSEHMSQPDDPNSMLKGMKGYQLIPSDLEFIKKMQQEKLLKKLQVMVCLFSRSLLLLDDRKVLQPHLEGDCCVVVH